VRKVIRSVVVACVASSPVGYFVYAKTRQASEATRATIHTSEVVTAINRVKLLTHDLALARLRQESTDRVMVRTISALDDFRLVTADNIVQKYNADAISAALRLGDDEAVSTAIIDALEEEQRVLLRRQEQMAQVKADLALVFALMSTCVVVLAVFAFEAGVGWADRRRRKEITDFLEHLPRTPES